jgi:hypothetical protein
MRPIAAFAKSDELAPRHAEKLRGLTFAHLILAVVARAS